MDPEVRRDVEVVEERAPGLAVAAGEERNDAFEPNAS